MKNVLALATACILLGFAAGCNEQAEFNRSEYPDLAVLADWMTGSFSSQKQAESDSAYFDIQLEMVPIWEKRDDGFWLYVEQAVATDLEKPYRQRVYHLTRPNDSTYVSAVYTFEEPLRFARAWRQPDQFSKLAADSLTERSGCAITMHWLDSSFIGGTDDKSCESSLRGAAYATSEVRITPASLISWDRGWDSTGNQVWGAREGGYVFDKVRNENLEELDDDN